MQLLYMPLSIMTDHLPVPPLLAEQEQVLTVGVIVVKACGLVEIVPT